MRRKHERYMGASWSGICYINGSNIITLYYVYELHEIRSVGVFTESLAWWYLFWQCNIYVSRDKIIHNTIIFLTIFVHWVVLHLCLWRIRSFQLVTLHFWWADVRQYWSSHWFLELPLNVPWFSVKLLVPRDSPYVPFRPLTCFDYSVVVRRP